MSPGNPAQIVDVHTHVVPGEFPSGTGWPHVGVSGGNLQLVTRTSVARVPITAVDPEARLDAMDRQGVHADVLSPLPALLDYDEEAATSALHCRYVNEQVAAFCAHSPGRFYGLGMVPLQDVDLALEALAHVRELGLQGVEVGSHVNQRVIGDACFVKFFAEAERLGLCVLVHPLPREIVTTSPVTMKRFGMPAVAGIGATSVVAGRLPHECPRLRLAFTHGAGGMPFALGRATRLWMSEGSEGELSPLELARRYFYDTAVFDARLVGYLATLLGVDRLVVGSDFPALDRSVPPLPEAASLGLSENERNRIGWDNAMKWMFGGPGAPDQA